CLTSALRGSRIRVIASMRGTNVNFAFYGAAPDLGAFEFGPTNAPNPMIANLGTNVILSTGGWANRTSYLFASADLLAPTAQWTCVATNRSDLAGNCVFTNAIAPDVANRFYRIAVPDL